MPLEKIMEIVEKLPYLEYVNIIGLGEPLMHPEWDEVMTYFTEKKIITIFTTNGTLLTRENIAPISQFGYVHISLDSVNPEVYKTIRGADVSKTIENIKLLRHLKPQINMVFNVLVVKETIDYLQDLLPFAHEVSARILLSYPLTFNNKAYKRFYPKIKELKVKMKAFHKLAYLKYRARIVQGYPEPKLKACLQPFESLTVGVNGETYPCCYIFTLKGDDKPVSSFHEYYNDTYIKVSQEQYYLGNIFSDNPQEMFDCENIMIIRHIIADTPKDVDFKKKRSQYNILEKHKYCEICADRWGAIC